MLLAPTQLVQMAVALLSCLITGARAVRVRDRVLIKKWVELAVARGYFVVMGIIWGRKCGRNME